MKIEMGESLIFSWLRHIKGCQIVQTNWSSSSLWSLKHQSDLQVIMDAVDKLFPSYAIFGKKKKVSLNQFIAQAEVDVLGSSGDKIFAVDVAFHENGLGYGNVDENTSRIIKKSLRTAMCIYGYFDKKEAEIIFATPIIPKQDWTKIEQGIADLENELKKLGYGFVFKVLCDCSTPTFQTEIMDPVMDVLNNVSDTNELFLRSAKLLRMVYDFSSKTAETTSKPMVKVGVIANKDLRKVLANSSKVTSKEISDLQDKAICKSLFGIDYPVLDGSPSEKRRYYSKPVFINGKQYYLCSQWVEHHRYALEHWISAYQ